MDVGWGEGGRAGGPKTHGGLGGVNFALAQGGRAATLFPESILTALFVIHFVGFFFGFWFLTQTEVAIVVVYLFLLLLFWSLPLFFLAGQFLSFSHYFFIAGEFVYVLGWCCGMVWCGVVFFSFLFFSFCFFFDFSSATSESHPHSTCTLCRDGWERVGGGGGRGKGVVVEWEN